MIFTSGMGMGCASRCSALAEKLHEGGDEIRFVSWGPGLRFLRAVWSPRVTCEEMNSYPTDGYSSLVLWPLIFFRNVWKCRLFFEKWAPDVVVMDSDYHFAMIPRRGEIRVFLGQAHDVVDRARSVSGFTWKEKVHLLIRERIDAWIQRVVADFVFVPSFKCRQFVWSRVVSVPLLVRKSFRSPLPGGQKKIGLPSGSGFELQRFHDVCREKGAEVVSGIFEHECLNGVGEVVVQGGLSSISEVTASGRYAYVVPMRDHPEQMLNALAVESHNKGCYVGKPKRLSLLESSPGEIRNDGAEVVAEGIRTLVAGHRPLTVEVNGC